MTTSTFYYARLHKSIVPFPTFSAVNNQLTHPLNLLPQVTISKLHQSAQKGKAFSRIWQWIPKWLWNRRHDASPAPPVLAHSFDITDATQTLFARESAISTTSLTTEGHVHC